ncbi:zinc finger protein-domain-containing protein [Boeremia exigua]|uniref:zinc finger protein-domain-containing protein n=1 Tax=Boeremia exigua TaxID=749465 RepID=UPI001E8E7F51|nr:zinc finger protein-domain-containing protein [Boeremia exigua]KAH6644552.1 zinc finger protein-domain-containing protein [Boeremia exigua]
MSDTALQYRCIGKGFCGTVWALEDSDEAHAVKREDGGPGRSVTKDYNMHLRVVQIAAQYHISTSVPQCHQLVEPTDVWWHSHLHQFPAGLSACRALISERIPPVPRPISDKIVDLFCPDNAPLAHFVKTNPDDASCLIRPYLGRRRRQAGPSNSRFKGFSLRNVPLHINQMEALRLDTGAYAEAMADALALLHWGAQIDAADVEFVLAPPRASAPPAFVSDVLGAHGMWVLDFDCCRALAMDAAGIEQACAAFWGNDPFYPRPGGAEAADELLWGVFRQRFLETSRVVLGQSAVGDVLLAEKLIRRIEEVGLARSKDREKLA